MASIDSLVVKAIKGIREYAYDSFPWFDKKEMEKQLSDILENDEVGKKIALKGKLIVELDKLVNDEKKLLEEFLIPLGIEYKRYSTPMFEVKTPKRFVIATNPKWADIQDVVSDAVVSITAANTAEQIKNAILTAKKDVDGIVNSEEKPFIQ